LRDSIERLKRLVQGRRAAFLVGSLLLLLGLLAAGCGGATTTTAGGVTTTKPAKTTTTGAGGQSALIGVKIEATDLTPPDFTEALKQQKPLAVLFFTPGSVDDDKVRKSLDTVSPTTPDVTFFYYDYRTPSLYGDLASQLQIGYTPYAVFIDGANTVRNVSSGYIDEGTLKQFLANISQP
jgi:hypothetical protein